MIPAAQARKAVEGWADDVKRRVLNREQACELLIARLTPVYERAQECDAAQSRFEAYAKTLAEVACEADALRERAEHLEVDRDNWRKLWHDLEKSCTRAIERAERAEAERDKLRDRLIQAEYDERAFTEALTSALAEQKRLQACLSGTGVLYTMHKLDAAEADVARFSTLADERHDLLHAERRRNDELRSTLAGYASLPGPEGERARAALAATERKG